MIRADHARFVDERGRTLLLRGVNLAGKRGRRRVQGGEQQQDGADRRKPEASERPP